MSQFEPDLLICLPYRDPLDHLKMTFPKYKIMIVIAQNKNIDINNK